MEWLTVLLSILAALLAGYYFFCMNLDFFEKHGIPHFRPLPLLGNLARVMFRRIPFTDLLQSVYGIRPEAKYVGFFAMMRPVLIIRDPALIKSIAVKNFDSFPDHASFSNDHEEPLISKNLSALRGQRWRSVRALLSPSFTSSRIKAMFVPMSRCAADLTDFLANLPVEKREMDMKDVFTRYTNDVITCCAFGIKTDSMRNPDNEFLVCGKEVIDGGILATIRLLLVHAMPRVCRMLGITVFSGRIAKVFKEAIERVIEHRRRTGESQPDMLQLMLDSRSKGGALNVEDMVSQSFVFFIAGFDIVSSVLSFAAHEMACHPEIQERLRREIDSVLSSSKEETVDYEAVNRMKYLEAVVNETLRMYPVAFLTDRVCEKSFELPPALPGLKPFRLKKGTNVWFPTFALQHDPLYFEEPDKFRPERFLDEDKKVHRSGAFLPFGIGPRVCIGNRFALMEIKVLIFHLLARCQLKVSPKTGVPMRLSRKRPVYPEAGFWLAVEPRGEDIFDAGLRASEVEEGK